MQEEIYVSVTCMPANTTVIPEGRKILSQEYQKMRYREVFQRWKCLRLPSEIWAFIFSKSKRQKTMHYMSDLLRRENVLRRGEDNGLTTL